MKNTKSLKIALLVISAALLLGAAVGITASAAEETSAPVIVSQNVEYGGNYALMYAVKADSVSESVTLKVYDNAACEGNALWTGTIAATEANQQTVKGVQCYVFTTNGIPAKDMDTQFYVKVSSTTGETVKRYSVAEYLYERLYKNGVAFSADEGDVKRAELYNTILLYGKQAQDVLFNYDANPDNDRDTFVTDTRYVYVADGAGTVDGTFASGIVVKGNKVVFSAANANIPAFDLYDLETGKKISTIAPGSAVTVNSHIKAVAYNPYSASKYADVAENYNGKSYSDLSSFITIMRNHWAKEESITDGVLCIHSKEAGEEIYTFNNVTAATENYVFETDIRIANFTTGRDVTFLMTASSTAISTIYGMGFNVTFGTGANEGYYVLKASGNGTKEYNLGISTSSSTNDSGWLNIRYEVDGFAQGSAVRFIVNGEVIDSFVSNRAVSSVAGMQMTLLGTYNGAGPVGNFFFDNTYSGAKKAESLEFGVRGSGAYYDSAYKFENVSSLDALISAGVMNAHATYGLGAGRSLSFADDAMTWKSTNSSAAWGAMNFALNGNAATENLVFETDVKLTGFVGDSARATYIVGSSSAGTGLGGAYALNLQFFNVEGGYGVKIANCADYYVIPENTWVNVRYEFDGLGAGAATRLVVNGEVVLETTNSQALVLNSVDILAQSSYGGDGFGVGTIAFDNMYLGAKK